MKSNALSSSSNGEADPRDNPQDGSDDDQVEEDPPEDRPGEEEEEEEEEEGDLPDTEWTVMVYLAGDNNLEEAALIDLNEMEAVGSTDEVNLLIEIDRSPGYVDYDGNWSGARRYRAEKDDDRRSITSPVLVDLGQVDSGRPEAFIDFVAWSVENYPAKRYAFIIWDHGWGWTLDTPSGRKGVASDDSTGSSLSIAGGDYEEILVAAQALTDDRLTLVGMDACLMANWETARVTAPYADIYVASQATESLDGWAFDTSMQDLVDDPEMDAAELGTFIAQRFYETDDSTLSAVDLAALVEMDGAIDELAFAIMDADNPRAAVRRHVSDTQNFDGDPNDRDLGDFAMRLVEDGSNEDIAIASDDLIIQLEESIVANFTNGGWVRDATGLSIYLPTRRLDDTYRQGSWNDLTMWDEMLDSIQ
ncbi:MAG: clostripain-related cysteine peptidase [Myxococcota bacterium]